MSRGAQGLPEECDDVDVRLSKEQKARARWLICGNAQGNTAEEQLADATLLMQMLGVHPDDNEPDFLIGPTKGLNSMTGVFL